MNPGPAVVKVGGSLYDLPDLGPRLERWVNSWVGQPLVLIPGGGFTANVVRELDQVHQLGEEKAHWLALRAMTLNAWFLADLPRRGTTRVVQGFPECEALWRLGTMPILDAHAFAWDDEGRPGCLPHSWSVTSDSVAARVAVAWGASRLILLKSVSAPAQVNWAAASVAGLVDPFFPHLIGSLPAVEVVNFREAASGRCR